MLNTVKAFEQGCNGQLSVDSKAQVIVAVSITQCAADSWQLVPMTEAARANTKRSPKVVRADAGYKSDNNFNVVEAMCTGLVTQCDGDDSGSAYVFDALTGVQVSKPLTHQSWRAFIGERGM
jgi:hypothetical protein